MANPIRKPNTERMDMDGIAYEVEQIIINDNVVVSTRQALVANPAAATAGNPAAPTTFSAPASGATAVTSNAATDLDTTSAALATLVTEVATYETVISELIVDTASLRAQLTAVLTLLKSHGLMSDV